MKEKVMNQFIKNTHPVIQKYYAKTKAYPLNSKTSPLKLKRTTSSIKLFQSLLVFCDF